MGQEFEEFKVETPTLTFGTEVPEPKMEAVTVEKTEDDERAIQMLTPQEQKMVDDFSKSIDLRNYQAILEYGAGTQKKMADFSDSALQHVRTKDMGEVGGMLTNLVVELKSFDVEEQEKGFKGFFKKNANKATALKVKYDKAEVSVNKVVDALETHQTTLLKDIAMLDKMYDANLAYFKELSMYIIAGKKKLNDYRNIDIVQAREAAERSGLPEDVQKVKDMEDMALRFEKKIYDLELTRTISLQSAPQIRLIQNNDSQMVEKIQSSIVNTIPLWKNQMVLALGIEHSENAAKAQREVTNMTNELLKKNSEMLKTASVEIAEESERGIIDIETLTKTNENLITTLDEVMRIQQEGSEKRRSAEVEMARIENELKNKLLDMKK